MPYFGRWPWLVNGSLLPMMLRAATRSRSEVSPDLYRGPEWSLLAALHWYRLPVDALGPREQFFAWVAVVRSTEDARGERGPAICPISTAARSVNRLQLAYKFLGRLLRLSHSEPFSRLKELSLRVRGLSLQP